MIAFKLASGGHFFIGSNATDTFVGTAGNDTMLGRGGVDTFELDPDGGQDRVLGFRSGEDKIEFAADVSPRGVSYVDTAAGIKVFHGNHLGGGGETYTLLAGVHSINPETDFAWA